MIRFVAGGKQHMYQNLVNNILTVYNAGIAMAILLLLGQITSMNKKIDKNILKARMFLDGEKINNILLYLALAGASLSIATLSSLINTLYNIKTTQITLLAQITFLITFLLAVYTWHRLLSHSIASTYP
jgi:drug/metabolite transporter (DMT)-like permease